MTTLDDLRQLAKSDFRNWESLGNIKGKYRDDLVLLAYTKQAQAEGTWSEVERLCRGLILRVGTGEIVARPFDKFFNWGEGGTDAELLFAQEKMDGSLGIHYRHEGKHYIATRGSFESPQALWATQKLREYLDGQPVPDWWTMLFEIIYPDNRIVVDYEGREELSLLSIRSRESGFYVDDCGVETMNEMYGFPRPLVYAGAAVEDLVAAQSSLSSNEEGFVGVFADGSRWKFKGEEYRKMHRFATQLTPKAVLDAFQEGATMEAWERVPSHRKEEFAQTLLSLIDQYVEGSKQLDAAMSSAPKSSRKEFASWVSKNVQAEYRAATFNRLDNKPTHKNLCGVLSRLRVSHDDARKLL